MKKLLVFAVISLLLLGLAACDAQNPGTTTVPATTHDHFFEIRDVADATCEEQGYARYACTCGAEKVDYTDALGHEYTSEMTKEPLCNEQGEITYFCHCGHTYTEAIDTTDHNWGNWFVDIQPTFTTKGQEKHICVVCNEFETRELDTNTVEQELERIASLAQLLPAYGSVRELSANFDLFNWVRVEAGILSSDMNEETYAFTLRYSLDTFDAVTQQYFEKKFDWASLAQRYEEFSVDTANNQLIWVTYGAGGWGVTVMESFEKIDDTHYSIRYFSHDYDEIPRYYGTLKVKLTDQGFVIESHIIEN